MITYLLNLLILLCAADNTEIPVRITNLEPDSGTILVAVYDRSDAFLSEQTYSILRVPVNSNDRQDISIRVPEQGTFAVSVFIDLNGNEELDKNMFGIPSEPYGFSNNPSSRFGPPSYHESSVDVKHLTPGQILEIKMK